MIEKKNKIYFASDFHLGSPNHTESLIREQKICKWLTSIEKNAQEIYLVGDIFDFWFEYKHVIPKGFERLKGKLVQLKDSGTNIHFFPGNHDLWTFGYLEKELGFIVHKKPLIITLDQKKFYITHGDGLGEGGNKYKLLKSIFSSSFCQWCFSTIHPDLGIRLANAWSKRSRKKGGQIDKEKLKNILISYSKEILKKEDINYFIFGHIHDPVDIKLTPNSRYINIGDCITHFSYLEFHENNLLLKYF